LTNLNISSNCLTRGALKPNGWAKHGSDLGAKWGRDDDHYDTDMSGVTTLANAIKDMGALTALNLASNNLGQLVPPEGWTKGGYIRYPDIHHWSHTDGRKEEGVVPSESKPAGIVALADAIPDMRAMTSLNLASNKLGVEGAEIIAACISKCT
jgi:hypothetical protein